MPDPTLRPWTAEDADEEPSYLLVSPPGAFQAGESAVVGACYRREDREVILRALRLLDAVEAPSVETVEAIVEALESVPWRCMDRHYGAGPYTHESCAAMPDREAEALCVLAALRRLSDTVSAAPQITEALIARILLLAAHPEYDAAALEAHWREHQAQAKAVLAALRRVAEGGEG